MQGTRARGRQAARAAALTAAALLAAVQAHPAVAIEGGTPATYGQIPWEVAIDNPDDTLDCSGSIIDQQSILTAAHCVTTILGPRTGLTVRYNSLQYASGGTTVAVDKVTPYPSFDPLLPHYNDIALLHLAAPITYGPDAQPVALPPQGEDPAAGTMATVAGWGPTQPGGTDSPTLMTANEQVVSRATCQAEYGPGQVTDTMICAAGSGVSTCDDDGDGGAPLVLHSSTPMVVGVVSWAAGCARPNDPGVYSNVGAIRNWIIANKV